ncbi:MAG: uncharacterized protein KVP18_003847 [Porospora cf. gigantea A]|uniref:uncharacterized protein n=1 Tax=Porospora cf. gigantea A TaxID=2853593 RepID=UPI00355A2C5C|nr:MAG: hypothetical protein KVP18_003847 [Porospora cf. gigantea A]
MFTYLKPNYTNSMNFPRRNEDLRAQEEADLHGQDLTVICRFVDGSKASYKVGYLKNLIARDRQVAFMTFNLRFNGKVMIDPMSLVDHVGVSGQTEIEVDVVSGCK